MKEQLLSVELKSGFNDSGPAWIGKASRSKTGRTIYFNGQAFQPMGGSGFQGNYLNIETGDEYWISGVKKDQNDRHRAGSGPIVIDESVVKEYLAFIGTERLNRRKYKVVRHKENNVRSRVNEQENRTFG